MLAIVSSPTSIYAFWLSHWYLLAIVSSVLLWFMPSDYPFGIFWPLYRLSYFDVCLLITPLSSFGQCIVCPTLIYAFWLPLWYLLAIVSAVLRFTASDYPFAIGWPLYRLLLRSMPSDYHIGIYWPLYRLSYFDLCLLITPLVSFGHCIVCPTLIYAFWLPFGIFWPLYRLSYFDLCLLITPLLYFGQCIVCPTLIYAFWLPLCFLLASVSSVLLWLIPSDYTFVFFWPVYRLSYFDLCLLITTLVSFAHCIFCPTSMYAFWLPLWYLLAIVSSVLLWCMPSDYPLVICWPLYRLSYFDKCLLITTLVSFGHCIFCPTSINAFWLSLSYMLAIVSSLLLRFMPSDCHIGIFWPLYRLSYFNVCFLINTLIYFGHCIICSTLIYAFWLPYWYLLAIVSSVLLWFMPSDYPFGIFCPLYRLSYFDLCLLIILWYLLAIVSSVLLRLMPSDYPFGILWPLYRLSYFDLCLLITLLVSFGHCIVCSTLIYAFWLPLWYLVAIVSSLLLRFEPSDYPFVICWPLYRLSFNLRLLITPLLYVGHCITCPSIYGFWLPLCYMLAIVSSVLQFTAFDYPFAICWPLYHLSFNLRLLITPWLYMLAIVSPVLQFTASDYPLAICWPLYHLSFNLRLLITPLLYVGHCIICPSIYASDYPFDICWPLYHLSFDLRLLIIPLLYVGHYIICPSIYGFWLPLCYMLAIVSSVLRFTASDYPFAICWLLYRLSFDLRFWLPLCYMLAIVSSPTSIYAFWLPHWYLLAIVSSVLLWFMPSDYPFGIFWPVYRLSYFDLCLLITPLLSFGQCIVCPTLIYAFWLPLLYLLPIVSSVLLWFMPSDYPLVSFGHCIVCPSSIDAFWLPLWYLVAIVSSVLLRFMPSDYPFGIIWPLYRLFYFDLCLLITPLVSCGHCIVCPSSIWAFWLPLCYMLAIVSSVLQFTASDYPFAICWPLYRLSFNLRLLITPLLYAGHCTICPSIYGFWLPLCYMLAIVSCVLQFTAFDYPFAICWPLYHLSSIYRFWLPLGYMLAIVSSVLQFTASDYPFAICWPLYHLSFNLRFWLPLCYMLAIISSVLRYTASDYPFAICWPLYHLSFDLRLLITPLLYVGHCIICPSIYGFWLPLCYMLAIISSVLRFTLLITPLLYVGHCIVSYFDLCLLITTLVSIGHCIVCPTLIYAFWLPLWYLLASVSSVLLWFMPSDYPFVIFWPVYRLSYFDLCLLITPLLSFGQCIVCPTLIYAFWLHLCFLLASVSSVLLWLIPSDYTFVFFWPVYRLSYFDLCLLITTLVSFAHCIFCPTSMYAFWLPLWYLLAIVSSVLLWCMPSDYPLVICWPLYRLSYFDKCLLITTLVSFGHCIFCPTSINAFWLSLSYMLAIVSSVLLRFMPSDCHIGIFWPLYRLSYFNVCFLITTLIYFGHCIICSTLIDAFWLPYWYLLAIVSSVLLRFMPSDYPFGIFCPLYCLSYFDLCLLIILWYLLAIVSSVLLRLMPSDYPFGILWPLYRLFYFDLCLLITLLVSFGHCIVCSTLIYAFWLSLWYLVAIVSSVLLRFVPSDYPFVICWPLYRLSFDLCLLITPLLYVGHCIICPTSINAFWLPLCDMLAILSSVLLRFMPSDYPFGVFWPVYRLSYFH